MFFFIGGYYSKDSFRHQHQEYCPACGQNTAFNEVSSQKILSLFFIPVPLGSPKILDRCTICGYTAKKQTGDF